MAQTVGRNIAAPLLFLNLIMYLIVVGFASWCLNRFINGQTNHPSFGGNGATMFFLTFALLAGVLGVASKFIGGNHIRAWRSDSLAAAGSTSLIAWAITALAFGLACKEINLGQHRGWRLLLSSPNRVTKIEMESVEGEASLRGQAEIWKHMFAFIDSLALKCAIELRIPDIIHSHGGPITSSQIASSIDSPSSPEISYIERIMRLLGHKNIFAAQHPSDGGEPLYGLTHSSRWLVTGPDSNQLGPVFLVENHPYMVNSWHFLSQCVKEGGSAIEKAFGGVYIDLASKDQQFNKIFNEGMACNAKFLTREILAGYKHGFDSLKSLVDVAGGIGGLISEIVKSCPHIKGINFDLPHVITTAPVYDGVTHVSGDMFHTIPNADALLLKWVLHNWSDEACVKILKNCRKAIPEKTGKVIIIDVVLQPDSQGLFDDAGYACDLVMMVNTAGGKERTELEWKKLLEGGGFPRCQIIKIPALQSIIEAYPE